MPIRYSVSSDGHRIHAIASVPTTSDELIEYEVAHAIDERIKAPVSELLEIQSGALKCVTKEDLLKVLDRRKESTVPHTPHRCGIVVSLSDAHGWNLARFYEGMMTLHFPETVIIFGDIGVARTWLGFEEEELVGEQRD